MNEDVIIIFFLKIIKYYLLIKYYLDEFKVILRMLLENIPVVVNLP